MIDGNILSISGFTSQQATESHPFSSSSSFVSTLSVADEYPYLEMSSADSNFQLRSFPVPDELREDELKVTLKETNGTLTVVIPKEPNEPRIKREILIELGGEGEREKVKYTEEKFEGPSVAAKEKQ